MISGSGGGRVESPLQIILCWLHNLPMHRGWRARYDRLLLEDWNATLTSGPASRPYFAVAAAHLNLGYE